MFSVFCLPNWCLVYISSADDARVLIYAREFALENFRYLDRIARDYHLTARGYHTHTLDELLISGDVTRNIYFRSGCGIAGQKFLRDENIYLQMMHNFFAVGGMGVVVVLIARAFYNRTR